MVKKDNGYFRLSRDLTDRIDGALGAFDELNCVEEVTLERIIHHSKPIPHTEVKRSYFGKNVVRVAFYAKGGYGFVVKLAGKGIYGMREAISNYCAKKINSKPDLYLAV